MRHAACWAFLLLVLATTALGCGNRCAAQDAVFAQTSSTCCPQHAKAVWNGRTCLQPHDCGCWTCQGKNCGDAYPDLASCAAAHESCVR
jgi:hypothetical protein